MTRLVPPLPDGAALQLMRQTKIRDRYMVVVGEFLSGKSSVINLLLREEVQSYNFQYRAPETHLVKRGDGTDALLSRDQNRLSLIEMSLSTPSAICDDNHQILAGASLIVWCTMASQAWRLSEAKAVERIRKSYRGPLALAVTRADLVDSARELEKLLTRLTKEAPEHIDMIVPILGSRQIIQKTSNAGVWFASGAKAISGLADRSSTPLPKAAVVREFPTSRAVGNVIPFCRLASEIEKKTSIATAVRPVSRSRVFSDGCEQAKGCLSAGWIFNEANKVEPVFGSLSVVEISLFEAMRLLMSAFSEVEGAQEAALTTDKSLIVVRTSKRSNAERAFAVFDRKKATLAYAQGVLRSALAEFHASQSNAVCDEAAK